MWLASTALTGVTYVARTFADDVKALRERPSVAPYHRSFKNPAMAHAMQDRALEWFSALVMLGWGVVFALPGDQMVGPTWEAFHRYGTTEAFWSWVFGMCGAARLAALYINGRWPRGPVVRMLGSLFGAVSWAQVTYMLTVGSLAAIGTFSTGTVVYGLLTVADLFSIYRSSFDARYQRN